MDQCNTPMRILHTYVFFASYRRAYINGNWNPVWFAGGLKDGYRNHNPGR